MHAKAAIVTGIAVAVLGGGGIALAQSGAPEGGTTQAADVRAAATISRAEAERIAVAKAGGGVVRETEMETEEGALVWKVEVIARGVEHDVYIDTHSGNVVRHRIDDDDRGDGVRGDDDFGDDDFGDDGPRHDLGDDHGGLRHDFGDDDRHGDDDFGDDHGHHHGEDDHGHHGDDDDHGGHGEG